MPVVFAKDRTMTTRNHTVLDLQIVFALVSRLPTNDVLQLYEMLGTKLSKAQPNSTEIRKVIDGINQFHREHVPKNLTDSQAEIFANIGGAKLVGEKPVERLRGVIDSHIGAPSKAAPEVKAIRREIDQVFVYCRKTSDLLSRAAPATTDELIPKDVYEGREIVLTISFQGGVAIHTLDELSRKAKDWSQCLDSVSAVRESASPRIYQLRTGSLIAELLSDLETAYTILSIARSAKSWLAVVAAKYRAKKELSEGLGLSDEKQKEILSLVEEELQKRRETEIAAVVEDMMTKPHFSSLDPEERLRFKTVVVELIFKHLEKGGRVGARTELSKVPLNKELLQVVDEVKHFPEYEKPLALLEAESEEEDNT